MKSTELFRYLFIFGILVIMVSMFTNFYVYKIYNTQGILLAELHYNLFWGWVENLASQSSPYILFDTAENPTLLLSFILLCTVGLSLYCGIRKDFMSSKNLASLPFYSFVNLLLLGIIFYTIFILPLTYFAGIELYYPFVIITMKNLIFSYTIDMSYILLLTSFIAIFPYSISYFVACHKYRIIPKKEVEMEKKKPKKELFRIEDEIDFNEYIKEEGRKLGIDPFAFPSQLDYLHSRRRLEGAP